MGFNRLVSNQANRGLKRITGSIKNLEAKQGHPIMTAYGTVSLPPTIPEIEAIFDSAVNVGTSFIGLIVDSVKGNQWLVWTDALQWYIMAAAGSVAQLNGARIYRSTNLTLASSAALSSIPFTAEVYDSNNYHDNAVNNTRITIPEDGTYTITATVAFDTDGVGIRRAVLIKDTIYNIAADIKIPLSTENTFINLATTDYFLAGEFVELYVNQNSGSNIDLLALIIAGVGYAPLMSIVKH